MQTSDYLTSLQNDKQNLATKLSEKGVTVTGNETFTELVPKFDEIQGGGDASEYFREDVVLTSNFNAGCGGWTDKINKLPKLSQNDFSNPKVLSRAFTNFRGENLDLSNFNTSEVITMSSMFSGCWYLKNLDLSNFNTSQVNDMSTMFSFVSYNMYSMKNLNISNFDMGKLQNVTDMLSAGSYNTYWENINFGYNLGKGYTVSNNNCTSYTLRLEKSNKLSHDSLMSIINGFYDLNITYGVYDEEGNELGGTLYTQKLVIGTTNMAKLTAEDIAIATNKGWTVS